MNLLLLDNSAGQIDCLLKEDMTPVQLNCHQTVALCGSDVVSRSPNIIVLMRSDSHIGFGCLFGFSRRQMRLENILDECQPSAADFAFATQTITRSRIFRNDDLGRLMLENFKLLKNVGLHSVQ